MLDGELYSHAIPFQTIQSIVRGDSNVTPEQKRQISFNIFAAKKRGVEWEDTEDMVKTIAEDVARFGSDLLVLVPYKKVVNTHSNILQAMMEFTSFGFEGIMLRHPEIAYEWKRGNGLLKYKPFIEHDFIIVGAERGDPDGKFASTLGALIIEGEYKGKKIRCEVGSGFSEVGVEWLDWNGGDWGSNSKPPRDWLWHNKERLVGLTLETQFQAVTDKPDADGIWSLQFASYRQLKLDR
jgi:DNA ligase-1